MAQLLQGVALITGAGSGIGRATSLAFTRHGIKKLAILDINESGLESTKSAIQTLDQSVDVLAILVDVAVEDSVVLAIQKVIAQWGRLDVAVNNAGFGGPIGPSAGVSVEAFRKVIDTNMIGLWTCQREEIKYMLKQDLIEVHPGVTSRGIIVNMSSMFGLVGPSPLTPAAPYVSSKHGVLAITKNDANCYAKDGIRINAICPGYVNTEIMRTSVGASDIMQKEMEKTPMGRFAEPIEIAEAISFLASPMSSFMSGASLVVDGGYSS